MKRLPILFALPILLMVACNSNKKDSVGATVSDSRTVTKAFSDLNKLDTFKVSLNGKDANDMVLNLKITAYTGKEIYSLNIKGTDLIRNYKESVSFKNDDQKLQFLKEELNLFFDDENFLEPAVTADEQPDQHVPDKEFYAELKQTGLNGFNYRLGKETKVYIAWSSKEQLVKRYYQCCQL